MTELNEREEGIFNEAKNYSDPEKRSAYLQLACHGDVSLQQRLERLLEAAGRATDFFQVPASADEDTVAGVGVPLSEGPGTVIGRYKILQQIGEGGMGAVFMAEQTEPVVRKVALKIIKLGMDTRQVVARFEAERQALAMMDHPNIARVLDAGSTESGRPYFVMELVKGVPITDYCDKNKLSTEERLKLFMPVCHAIQHAHQKGIIHRDIKPANVMVTLHDGHPVPKVIDFGIAKATNQKLTEKTLFTNYAQMIGTPAYMSPEQAELSGLDVDTRTDVYSLGVLLYELLTGTTPFPAKELMSMGYGEMQRVIAETEPPKPSTRLSTMGHEQLTAVAQNRCMDVSAVGKVFSGDLDWIVMKALEKDRTHRYETVNGLVADVKRHLDDEPVTAAAPTFSYQLRKFYRRNRSYLQIAASVVVLLLISVFFSSWQAVLAKRAQAYAEAESERASGASEDARREKENAEAKREEAERATKALRRELYLADMSRIASAYEANNREEMQHLLVKHIPATGEDDLRGLEWRMWMGAAHREVDTLSPFLGGDQMSVSSVKQVAVFSLYPGIAQVVDLKTLELVIELPFYEEWENVPELEGGSNRFRASISPDGKWLVAVCADGRIRRWRTSDWERVEPDVIIPLEAPIKGGNYPPFVTWSEDGTRAVVSTEIGPCVYSFPDWKLESAYQIPESLGDFAYTRFSGFGDHLIAVVYDQDFDSGTIATLEYPFDKVSRRIHLSGSRFFVSSSPGKDWLVVCRYEHGLEFRKSSDLTLIDGIEVDTNGLNPEQAVFSDTGERMAIKLESGVIRVWDTRRQRFLGEVPGDSSYVSDFGFMPDEKRLIVNFSRGVTKIWDPRQAGNYQEVLNSEAGCGFGFLGAGRLGWRDLESPLPLVQEPRILRRMPDSNSVRVSKASPLRVYDIEKGEAIDPTFASDELFVAHSMSSNGRFFAGLKVDGTLALWDTLDGRMTATTGLPQPYQESGCYSLVVANDGGRAAWIQLDSGEATRCHVWNIGDGQLRRLEPRETGIRLSFDNSGEKLAQIVADGGSSYVEILSLDEHHLSSVRTTFGGPSFDVKFSPTDSVFAFAGWAQRVELGLLGDLGRRQVLSTRHSEPIHELVYSVDGQQIISGGGDRWVKIWDARTGEMRSELPEHDINHWVTALLLDPNDEWFGLKLSDEPFQLWRIPALSETHRNPRILQSRLNHLAMAQEWEEAEEIAASLENYPEVAVFERFALAARRGDEAKMQQILLSFIDSIKGPQARILRAILACHLPIAQTGEIGITEIQPLVKDLYRGDLAALEGIAVHAGNGLALAAYRSSEWQQAWEISNSISSEKGQYPHIRQRALVTAAMASHQLGNVIVASQLLEQAREVFENGVRAFNSNGWRVPEWALWTSGLPLLREAEQLIEGKATTTL